MDHSRFDAVVRNLSASETRRGVFKTLAVVGGGLALTQIGAATAKQNKKKKGSKSVYSRCKKSSECKGALLCQNSNSQKGCFDVTEKRCCAKEGQRCDNGCDCCGVDVICSSGYCQSA